jgi:hypothetical protein
MVRRAEITAIHKMPQVAHRGHELICEGGHVAHSGFVRLERHLPCVLCIQRDWLFTEDMFARARCGDRDRRVEKIRRGDDDRVDVITRTISSQFVETIGAPVCWRADSSVAGFESHSAVTFTSRQRESPGRWFCRVIPPVPIIPTFKMLTAISSSSTAWFSVL